MSRLLQVRSSMAAMAAASSLPLLCGRGGSTSLPSRSLLLPGSCGASASLSSSAASPALHLLVGSACLGKKPTKFPGAKCSCGEDAFYVLKDQDQTHLGVADGVGGWADKGVDPAEFAWTLINHCEAVAKASPALTPLQILTKAHDKVLNESKLKEGSSTASLLTFRHQTRVLESANLGDSGFVVIRNDRVLYQSEEQQHAFNAPFQLSAVQESSNMISNSPQESAVHKLELQRGDAIILATDGLFDNVFPDSLVIDSVPFAQSALKLHDEGEQKTASKVLVEGARTLVNRARSASQSKAMSPFATKAAQHGYRFFGGKPDDITVLLALVVGPVSPKEKSNL